MQLLHHLKVVQPTHLGDARQGIATPPVLSVGAHGSGNEADTHTEKV